MNDRVHGLLVDDYGLKDPNAEFRGLGQGGAARYAVKVGDRQFMAKHLGSAGPSAVAYLHYECGLLGHLATAEIPVNRVVSTQTGETFAMLDDRPFVLYEWEAGGIEWPTSPERARALGGSMAALHLASSGFSSPVEGRLYDIDRLVDRPIRLLEPFAGPGDIDDLRKAGAALLSVIEEIPIDALTFGPIHGDIHQGNCLFRGDALVLLDFALCGVGYRAFDFTGFLWPMRDRSIRDDAMRAACESFMQGYERVRQLHPSERAAIHAMVQIRTLWETADWVDTGDGRRQPENVSRAIPHVVSQIRAGLDLSA